MSEALLYELMKGAPPRTAQSGSESFLTVKGRSNSSALPAF